MAHPPLESTVAEARSPNETVRASLERIEELAIAVEPEDIFEPDRLAALCDELRQLHARIRMHHAAGFLSGSGAMEALPPELADERCRLAAEYLPMLGQLDRILRTSDSILDRSVEDKEVFVLCVRELFAVVQRHIAEEDRLFYLAVWRDVGGES